VTIMRYLLGHLIDQETGAWYPSCHHHVIIINTTQRPSSDS